MTYGGFISKVQSVTRHGLEAQLICFTLKVDVVRVTNLPEASTDPICPVLMFNCDGPPELNMTGGTRVPTVANLPFDSCSSDIVYSYCRRTRYGIAQSDEPSILLFVLSSLIRKPTLMTAGRAIP